jgi:hypothetical protein
MTELEEHKILFKAALEALPVVNQTAISCLRDMWITVAEDGEWTIHSHHWPISAFATAPVMLYANSHALLAALQEGVD